MSDTADDDQAEADAYTLSFIDVVSCGLAAALLLFLVYTVLPHMGRSGSLRANVTSMYAPPGIERNTSGLAKDERSAKLAITVMTVVAKVPPTLAPTVKWKGLPRECHSHVIRMREEVMFVASCARGVPRDVIVSLVANPGTVEPVGAKAKMFVGGSAALDADCPLPAEDSDTLADFTPSKPHCLVRTHVQ